LRAFAAPRAVGQPAHEAIFGPLIAARRTAARMRSPDSRVAAFDAERLRRAWREAMTTIAAERTNDTAGRRAVEAAIEEAAAPLWRALDALEAAGRAVRTAGPTIAPDDWAAWCRAVQATYDAADLLWFAVETIAPPRAARHGASRLSVLSGVALVAMFATAAAAQHVTVRVAGARPDSLAAAGFDVVGVEPGAVLVVVDARERARLGATGLRTTDLPLRQVRPATPVVYRSYDDPVRGIRAWVDSIVRVNPRVSVDTIGRSFDGRPMFMLKVGARGDSPQRPNVVFVATYHAREWVATEMAMRLIRYLAQPPGTDARRDSLVAGRDIWILPVANPDGYQYTFTTDRLWRKTRSPQSGGAIGVDMNRNHSVAWGLDNQGSSPDPTSDIFRGPTPASEVEIKNIEAWHLAHPPVVALSYHTYSGLLLYPRGSAYGALAADRPVYEALAGTTFKSAVIDHVQLSPRGAYQPGPGWILYTTNGEYTDFAAERTPALSFTTELTSGYTGSTYYGFEFPDDDAQVDRVFQDNLPFALDLLDAASNPATFASATTGLRVPAFSVEAAAPDIRVLVPAATAASAKITVGAPISFRVDSTSGGRYTRRLISATVSRPPAFSVTAAGVTSSYRVLLAAGAESAEPAWTLVSAARDSTIQRAGRFSWLTAFGSVTSPPIAVPADVDTVTMTYWTMHNGSGFTAEPSGTVDVTTNGGGAWTRVMVQRGFAPVWYPDHVTIGGLRGKTVQFRFSANGMTWRIDEFSVVGHGGTAAGTTTAAAAQLMPSENPVRSTSVRFSWPFGASGGEVIAFDFAGRAVWRHAVTASEQVTWDLVANRVANGAYVIVARSNGRVSRIKLFVARPRS
jgi:hypothetical protein